MSAAAELAAEFAELRPYLLRVAYSHLGSIGDSEDVVQEAWLRLQRSDRSGIRDLRAWLATTVARLAIDTLTSARAKRERYVGTWLPEPVVTTVDDLADRVTLDESVSLALLVVLESLSPAERSAFLLHDVFGYSFDEVAEVVGRTPQAARQLASRARREVETRRPRFPASAVEQRRALVAFLNAAQNGDIATLLTLLDPDVVFRSDGGGLVTAARQVLHGAQRVAQVAAAMAGHYSGRFHVTIVDVNGSPGMLVDTDGEHTVAAIELDNGRIRSIDVIRNPEKLRGLGR